MTDDAVKTPLPGTPTQKDPVDQLVELCDALCSTDAERLSCLHDALATMHERMHIATAKADGGTTGEHWIAQHFKLAWQAEKKTGVDARDASGRACEIKASLHPLKTKIKTHKLNICYTTKARFSGAQESDDAFVARAQHHIRENTGGHFWATWVEKTPKDANDRIILRWWVPSVPLAQLIGKKMRASSHFKNKTRNTIAINFGAKTCRTCGGVHRIDAIVRTLGGWIGRTDTLEALAQKRAPAAEHAEIDAAALNGLDAGMCASQCE